MGDTPWASQATCETEGTLAVGYGSDVTKYASCAVVTNEWVWGDYYLTRVKAALDNTWAPHDWWEGFSTGAIRMVGWNEKLVSSVIRADAEQVVADIKDGKFNPFCGPFGGRGIGPDGKEVRFEVPAGKCLSDMTLLSQQWFVDGVESALPTYPPDGHLFELVDAPAVAK